MRGRASYVCEIVHRSVRWSSKRFAHQPSVPSAAAAGTGCPGGNTTSSRWKLPAMPPMVVMSRTLADTTGRPSLSASQAASSAPVSGEMGNKSMSLSCEAAVVCVRSEAGRWWWCLGVRRATSKKVFFLLLVGTTRSDFRLRHFIHPAPPTTTTNQRLSEGYGVTER